MKIVSAFHNMKVPARLLVAMTCLASVSASLGGEIVTSAEVKPGMRAFAGQDCVLLGGPDEGRTLKAGWMILCSRVTTDRVWASSSVTGWVSSSNLIPFATAEEYWKQRAFADPNDPEQLILLARIQTQIGKTGAAMASIDLAKEHSEVDADIRVISLIAATQSYGLDTTKGQIISLCETSRLTDYNAALLLSFLAHDNDVPLRAQVLDSIELSTTNSSCWLLQEAARVRSEQGNDDEALGLLNDVLKRDQWYGPARITRSIVLLQQNRINEATADAEECAKLQPDSPIAHDQLSACYFKAGNRQEGLESLRKALELAPNDPRICYSLGTRLVENTLSRGVSFRGEVTIEPLKLLEEACELTEFRNLDYVHQLAIAYATSNQATEAEALLKSCLEKYGHHKEYHDYLQETKADVEEVLSLVEPGDG